MSKTKAQSRSKNGRKTAGKRLGVKLYAGQAVRQGQVIVRQVGQTKRAGPGTYLSRNFSIHAAVDGQVGFQQRQCRLFTGRTTRRTEVFVKPNESLKPKAKAAAKA